jgi:hypothetical protein
VKTTIQNSDTAVESTSISLNRIGGIAALMAAGFAVIQIVIEFIGVGIMQIEIPDTILGWFMLLQDHRLLGLTALTMFQIPAFIFCVPVILALYDVLKQTGKAYMMVVTALAFLGITVYISSNTAFSILSLSRQYAAATIEGQKSMLLAAGQAMLATYEGVGVNVGLLVFMIAILSISGIMLHSKLFGRASAYAGILAGVVAIFYYLLSALTPNAIFILEASGLFFVAWIILVGRRLLLL